MTTGDSGAQTRKESDFLADWKARRKQLRAAQNALRELPASEYEPLIRDIIRTAPSSWHVRKLILQAVEWLKWLSKGRGDHFLGIPDNDEGVVGRVHFQLARIVRQFNLSLTAKSAPEWLLKAKRHPEFQKAWKEFSNTKGEHEREDSEPRIIEVNSFAGQRIRCVFGAKTVRQEWWTGEEMTRQETRPRCSSNGVLQFWLSDVLNGFDKSVDNPGGPLSQDWAERWADEELYMKHFMPHAECEWNQVDVDELQVSAGGLLTTNNNLRDGKPRYDFGVFRTRIKRLALKQIGAWRDSLVPPAKKVSQK